MDCHFRAARGEFVAHPLGALRTVIWTGMTAFCDH